jgi:hypothetical protein
MIYALQMRKKNKSVNGLLLRYPIKGVLQGKKPRISYKARISYLNLQLIILRVLRSQYLYHTYAQDIGAVIAIFLGIGGINVLTIL